MELLTAKDKSYTVKVNSTFIHSKYSPEKEAEKYIENSITHSKGTVIVIGAGLGYLYKALEKIYPELEIVGIEIVDELRECKEKILPLNGRAIDSINSIESFLKLHIREDNIRGLQIVEWQPSIKVSPDNYNLVNNSLIKRVRLINGNLMTTARFGKLWIKNSLKNYIAVDNYIKSFSIKKPIVIIASGSSLARQLKRLKSVRERVTIFALSSSLLALKEAQLEPDLVFSTDPGYYSKLHLYGYKGPLAMPLSNSTSNNCPVLLMHNGNFFENEILNRDDLPSIEIPENGTVAGTALLFSLKNSSTRIFLLGQDLGSSDIKSHVTPYTFDNLLRCKERRVNPYYNNMFSRWINSGVTYKTYRDWYSKIGEKWNGRIYRVDPNGAPIGNIEDITLDDFIELLPLEVRDNFTYTIVKNKPKDERIKDVISILKEWFESLNKKIDLNELIYLISPGKSTDESTRESLRFIKELLILYGRKLL